jgi:hypothetical protein
VVVGSIQAAVFTMVVITLLNGQRSDSGGCATIVSFTVCAFVNLFY